MAGLARHRRSGSITAPFLPETAGVGQSSWAVPWERRSIEPMRVCQRGPNLGGLQSHSLGSPAYEMGYQTRGVLRQVMFLAARGFKGRLDKRGCPETKRLKLTEDERSEKNSKHGPLDNTGH